MTYWEQIAVLVSVNALLALAAHIQMSAGMMTLSFGSFCGVGALTAATVHGAGFPLAIAAVAGAVAGSCVALAFEFLCHRQGGFMLVVSSIALTELARILVTNTDRLGGAVGFRSAEVFSSSTTPVLCLLGTSILLLFCERTRMRSIINLIGDDPLLANSLGIRIGRYRIGVAMASGGLSGCAGAFLIHTVGILDPRVFGVDFGLQVLTFAILGGRRWWGSLVASMLLTVVPEWLRFSFEYRMVLVGGLLVWTLGRFPGGISGVRLPAIARVLERIR